MLSSSCQQLITLMRFYSSQRDASMSNWVSDGLTAQLMSLTLLDEARKPLVIKVPPPPRNVFPLRSHLRLCLGLLEIQCDFTLERL